MATYIGFDPATYTADQAAPFTLGGTYSYQGEDYLFVKNDSTASGSSTFADGDVCAQTAVKGVVTNLFNGSGSSTAIVNNPPAGVSKVAAAQGKFVFILRRGRHTNVKSASTTAGLNQIMRAATSNSTCTDSTGDTIGKLGRAITLTSGGRCTVDVDC